MIRKLILLCLCLPAFAQQVNTFIPFGGVNTQTATYVIQASDVGKLVVMNCSSCTVSLPSSIPAGYNSQWAVWIVNQNATSLTVSPNGLQLNGSGSNITLNTNASIYVTTSASAYYGVQGSLGAQSASGTSPGVTLPARFWYTYGDFSAILSVPGGNNAATGLGTQGGVGATATETQGRSMSASATQSTNFVIGLESGCGASFGAGALSWGTIQRFSMRLTTTVSSTARYWVGLSDCRSGDFAGSSATFATDTPNLNYCMFRFSTTTDTTWKAVCATSNVAQTVVDTGVAISTSASTLFEIVPNATGTSATFFLNGNQVATISTNVMATNQLLGQLLSVDNKNTNTAEQINFYWSQELFTR